MAEPDWKNAVDEVKRYVVKISTPGVSGTGFLFAYSAQLCGVATAAHVVNHAHWWELPIRLHHAHSNTTIMLHHGERPILLDEAQDTAAIVFSRSLLPFPSQPLEFIESDSFLRVGNSVGWLGFPAFSAANLCFFRGTTSCLLQSEHAYLMDGVAINGVSGGPAFWAEDKKPLIVGVVSAYLANKSTGEALPGLSVVRDLKHLQQVVTQLKSLDEAKESEQATKPDAPPAPPTGEARGV